MLKYLFVISCNLISFQNLLSSNLLIKSFMSTPRTHSHHFIKKETLAQVFFCDFCEIFKDTFFYRTPLVATACDMTQH